MAPEIGDIQIGEASEYGYSHGYVIEEFGDNGWGVPDWTERSLPHLDCIFNTRSQALAALKDA
ncbi:hypothetical protein EN866_35075 [Mesorhizobium sp. M2D.F.Ca.ET.223.01.1.1]|uniref:hypothetical protein n=1 Tax=Mesorhizobium sp. M2D.F.Ca.ET.223.01.1.1 TaxID=2563940 RepID=UPI001092ECA9|nr:hypothetical protein [Mesorhizobium sp. M2D.F.Ca.ET.223.01.1.1]TGR81846.1 hypothetical protein EN866_35075 [Mesorhizobium sp. M2D.F.Ca.ET.223.01.1.1]TGT64468.1 hypothetical protein EN802_32285 [bacterium M00.F.Ca.ET.159.01.1.1]TGT79313.1 hypothetical protein EN800_31625 [bacterium M00.F.Ca.ET.157.01.1.1]